MGRLKIEHYIIIALILALIGGYVLYQINVQDDVEQEVKFDQLNKEDKQKIRDEAIEQVYSEIDTTAARIDTIIKFNDRIKYVPYKEIQYIDRTLDDAVRVIDTTEYGTE